MKYLYATIAFLLVTLSPSVAYGDDYSFKFGPGVTNEGLSGATKAFGLRYESHEIRGIYSAVEIGGYVDNAGGGRKGAGVLRGQVGIKPGPSTGLFGKAFVGPCVITTPDTQLGGRFPQFCTDAGLGVRDATTFMVIGYQHISSAGLRSPNKGKDWISFEVGVSL